MRRIANAMIWVTLASSIYLAISIQYEPSTTNQFGERITQCPDHPEGCPACRSSGPPLPAEIGEDNLRLVMLKEQPMSN